MVFSVEEALPPNIVCRLIVRRHEEIRDETLLWRKGAVLYYGDGDATAFITEDARNITVLVKGKDKTPYISSLRETLKEIFESYKEIKPDLKYEVLRPEDERKPKHGLDDEPFMVNEDVVRVHVETQRDFLDARSRELFSLYPTAKAYNVTNINFNNFVNGNINGSVSQTGKHVEDYCGAIVNSTIIERTSVNEKDFTQTLKALKDFLESPEAGKATYADILELRAEIAEAGELGHQKGWARLREYLATAADIVTLAAPFLFPIFGG